MKRRVLDLIVCPKCHEPLRVEASREEQAAGWTAERVACTTFCGLRGTAPDATVTPADCTACYATDVVEGALRCHACKAAFPIIEGIPRLVDPSLLARMQRRYPDFFSRHPEFVVPLPPGDKVDKLAETLESFTRQRLDLKAPGPEFVGQWREHLQRNLGRSLAVAELKDKLILDVGCGFGRHLFVGSEAGAEMLGMDLSGAVDVARGNNRSNPRCHIVQANIYERPTREDRFDVVWSWGVLHHTPDPRGAFLAIAPRARKDGGLVAIWVYGYDGMAFTYKLSHMRGLHRLTRELSHETRVRASKAVAAVLSALYWEPLRLLRRAGFGKVVKRMPLSDYVDHAWISRVAGVHDRLSTPITFFHDGPELREWLTTAGLSDPVVEDTDRRGWRAYGFRRSA